LVGQVGGKGAIQNAYLGEYYGAIEIDSLDDVTIWVIWCWCNQNCICFYVLNVCGTEKQLEISRWGT
jgi:hypothetical protein